MTTRTEGTASPAGSASSNSLTHSLSVYIVVLNWNGMADTAECLSSLQKITYPNYQVVVVDNGSTDGSVCMLRSNHPEAKIIENGRNLGFAQGNNMGVAWALKQGADYVLVLNNDTVVQPGFLEPLVAALQKDRSLGFASPKIYYYDHPTRVWFFGGKVDWTNGWAYHESPNHEEPCPLYASDRGTDVVTGCCLFASREALLRVGLFDPRYYLIYEDTDWCVRATRVGYKGAVLASSHIWHKVSSSFMRDLPEQGTFYFVRNGLLFIRKHARRRCGASVRFAFKWVVKPSIRRIRHRERNWTRTNLLAAAGVVESIRGRYGPAPEYVARLAAPRSARQ